MRRGARGLPDVAAPSLLLLGTEPMRALAEFTAALMPRRELRDRP